MRLSFSAASNSPDSPFATTGRAPRSLARSNTPGSPASPATADQTPPSVPFGNSPSRSAADAAGCADRAGKVSCNTGTCAGLGVSLPASITHLPPATKPPFAPAEERSTREEEPAARKKIFLLGIGKKIHRAPGHFHSGRRRLNSRCRSHAWLREAARRIADVVRE